MNILFFLTPKNEVAYVYEDETLRQTLEKMGNRRFSCIPILSREGRYVGTISEGDLLWTMMHLSLSNMKEAINQNFVPVIDDQGSFIGIVTRKAILKYCYAKIEQWQ